MTAVGDDWSFESAREPARFAAAMPSGSMDVEHAYTGETTLCGLAEDQVDVYRTLFDARRARACPRCRDLAATAATVPCRQDRLHDQVLAAEPGPYREQLLGLLSHGAEIRSWVSTPQRDARHFLDITSLTSGAQEITTLLAAHDGTHRIGIAHVRHGTGQFVIIVPEEGPPLIAWAASTTPA